MKTRFNAIILYVGDLPAMIAFYRDVIGLGIDRKDDGPYADFDHEGIHFSMFARSELPRILGQVPEYAHKLNGTFSLAVNVGKPENVDLRFAEIISKGGMPVYAPRDEPWKMRSAMLADPEGNMIEIASDFWD